MTFAIRVYGKPVTALLDLGSTVTLARPNILGQALQEIRTLPVSCVHGVVCDVPAAKVRVSTAAGEWPLLVGLIPELPVLLLLR